MNIEYITAPVKLGEAFMFKGRKCEVIRLDESSFLYNYVNPALKIVGYKPKPRITYNFWHKNAHRDFPGSQATLKAEGYIPSWDSPEKYAQRAAKRLKSRVDQAFRQEFNV